jgi:hypothetical protein
MATAAMSDDREREEGEEEVVPVVEGGQVDGDDAEDDHALMSDSRKRPVARANSR